MQRSAKLSPLLKYANIIGLFLICLVIVGLEFYLYEESIFVTSENLKNILMQVTINGVLAVGMTFVILTGGIDLSVGSMLALMGVIYLQIQNTIYASTNSIGLAIVAALTASLAVGAALGFVSGRLIGKFKIPPFIITLGLMSIARGGALLLSGATGLSDETDTFRDFANMVIPTFWTVSLVLVAAALGIYVMFRSFKLKTISQGTLAFRLCALAIAAAFCIYVFAGEGGIPLFILVFILVAALGSVVLRLTTFGRRVICLGGNEEAARLSGIRVSAVKTGVYVSMSILATLAALLTVARQGGISPGVTGVMAELDAIASVVIGGTSLSGGAGSIVGTIVGALIMGVLNNGMNILSIPSNWGYVMKGLVVVLAVWFDQVAKGKSGNHL